MGLNDELNYALQEDNEEIFGDQFESTVNVNLAEDTIVKPGIKLPKSESEWKTANSFFHANIPIEDMNTADGDFNDIATNFGMIISKNEYGIVREDEVNDFKVKYRNHPKNQLRQTLKKMKRDKTAENRSETRYVSKLLRSRIQNNQSKTNESSSLDGIDHDSKNKESVLEICETNI